MSASWIRPYRFWSAHALVALMFAAFSASPAFAQFTQQGPKLVASDLRSGADHGTSVAVSADGNTAIVGAPGEFGGIGSAWVWTRTNGVWTSRQNIYVSAAGNSRQGWSVAISADGATAIVGGPDFPGTGAAWVWTQSAGIWTMQAKLDGSGAVGNARQGSAVSLSADGNTAIVGGPNDNANTGAVWLWKRTDGVWVQQGSKLVGSGLVGAASQGSSVSLSDDGNTAIVGGPNDNSSAGATWVWTRNAGVWSQQGPKLVASDSVGAARQGQAMALSADGNTAIVGGPADNSYAGGVWVWTRVGAVWSQQGVKLLGTGTDGNAAQGWSVSLSSDGDTLVVGGPWDNSDRGATWVWIRNGGTWIQQGPKLDGSDVNGAAGQGASVSVAADGNTTLIGGPTDSSGTGAAWVWTRSDDSWTQQGPKLVLVAAGQARVSVSADGNTAILGGSGDGEGVGASWIWTRNGNVWTQGPKLVGSGAVGVGRQGSSVAISADGQTVLVGGPNDNGQRGAVWIWVRSDGTWIQQGPKLVGTGALDSAYQGAQVALSADGNTAIVGGPDDGLALGAVWVWTRSGSVWTQQGAKLVGSGAPAFARQGTAVALSGDGNTAMVGGAGYPSSAGPGAVWVWTRSGGIWTQQGATLTATGCTGQLGVSMALSGDGNTAIAGAYASQGSTGAACVWTRSGGIWTQQGAALIGSGATGQAGQGVSVSLSIDGNTAVVGGPGDNANTGAVWVWTRFMGVWTQRGTKLVGSGGLAPSGQGGAVSMAGDGATILVGGSNDNRFTGAVWIFVAPTVAATPVALQFAATKDGPSGAITGVTAPQAVAVTFSFSAPVWTISADQPWVQLSTAGGTGAGTFTVSIINPGNVLGGSTNEAATITLLSAGAINTPRTINVSLTIDQTNGAVVTIPIGQVDTPLQDTAGVQGAIALTGWALDNIGVTGVQLYRNCLAFENQANCQDVLGASVVYIGDATFLTGARPDVEAGFPTYPAGNRAGWGYLLLTSLLPHMPNQTGYGGQGPLTLYAVATDVEGHKALLGRAWNEGSPGFTDPTNITMANDTIAKPFGAIDSPTQGQTISGLFNNFGWALTPDSNTTGGDPGDILIPINGSTMTVFIDALPVALVAYNQCRGDVGSPVPAGVYCNDDVANIFGNLTPQPVLTTRTSNPTAFRNLDAGLAAIGAYTFDTATLANGLHTIAWSVTDSAGRTEGIGSRFFTVLNTGGVITSEADLRAAPAHVLGDASALRSAAPATTGVFGRTGFDLAAAWKPMRARKDGTFTARLPEMGRLELWLGAPVDAGYLVTHGELRSLPMGSSLSESRFGWMPPPGYVGSYELAFIRGNDRINVTVSVGPTPQVVEGEAQIRMGVLGARVLTCSRATAGQCVRIQGWAVDPQAAIGSGIGAVHVWARRGAATPVFLGSALIDEARRDASFSLTATLGPGTWELTAYVWNERTARWEDSRSVTIVVR